MQYINLIDRLPKEDKEAISEYIYKFGVTKEYFIGLEKFLEDWSHANQKLYHLLGDKFIHRFHFKYEKNVDDLRHDFAKLVRKRFWDRFDDILYAIINKRSCVYNDITFYPGAEDGICDFRENITEIFIEDRVRKGIKLKWKDNKMFQIQAGMKPIRAIQKFCSYFDGIITWKEGLPYHLLEDFEKFRIEHSMILNDKIVESDFCISIHPLDYMTMSDNNSDWESCMSWTEQGCYHEGTLEMMNSNNVLCCYIDSSEPFTFYGTKKDEDGSPMEYAWNNKKWRNLFYITKDIILSGKSYPYSNYDIDKIFLDTIKKLAEDNLHWTYKYGIEEYNDMKYVNSEWPFERARNYYMDYGHFYPKKKHNIYVETRGMYNDFVADHERKHYCYRNKVSKMKVISVSGKANCLCCGTNPIVHLNECLQEDDSYFDKWENCDRVVCQECVDTIFHCDDCDMTWLQNNQICDIDVDGFSHKRICAECFLKHFRRCPHCGKIFYVGWHGDAGDKKSNNFGIWIDEWLESRFNREYWGPFDCDFNKDRIPKENDAFRLYCCKDCVEAVKLELGMKVHKFDDYRSDVLYTLNNEARKYILAALPHLNTDDYEIIDKKIVFKN